ncbi:MAG: hypothetical protein IKA41_02340, partial [Bacteroidaceae bacterium]|nr:hypothetical protein [Bacteroidaceae bacterium]
VPIKLTTDDNNPICYLINSGRTEQKGSGKWYWKRNTSNDGSFKVVAINNNAENDIEAYWYFKEVDNSIQLIPYTTQRPMAYTDENEAANKINENGTGGSSFSLKIGTSDQQANFPYALIAYTKNDTNNTPVYISNFGGTDNNMGLYNGFSDWGTRFTIEPVTNNTKINYPEDGKAYYIKALYANDGHRYFYRNDAGKLQVSATKKDVFVFRDLGNNKYAVVNNYGEYLVYYADGKQGVGNTNDGFANTYEQGTNDAEVTFIPAKNTKVTNTSGGLSQYDVRRLGHFLIQAKMSNGTDYYMMSGGTNATSDGGDFHNGNATDIYFTDTRSSLFELEEVEYPNTPVLTTLNEGITAATFSSPFPTIAPEGVTAHKVSISGNYAVLTALEGAIPANTGVILTSENAGEVTMLPAASEAIATNAENNALEHSAGNEKDMTNIENAYILTLNGFNPCSGGTLGMNKSYLVVPTAMQSNSLSLRFDDGFTTGVENVDIENAPEVIYTIGGTRVNSATLPGLYIVNGKKVYVK